MHAAAVINHYKCNGLNRSSAAAQHCFCNQCNVSCSQRCGGSVATLLAGWSCHPILAVNRTKSCVSLLTRCVIPVRTLVTMISVSCPFIAPLRARWIRRLKVASKRIEASIWQPSDLSQAQGRYTVEPVLSTQQFPTCPSISQIHMKYELQPQVPQPSSLWFSKCTEHCTYSLASLISDVSQNWHK
jgi:hypothetical protein